MNDLVGRTQGHVEEVGKRYTWNPIEERHHIANLVKFLDRICGDIQMLLGTNDADFFAVVEGLAEERNVLEAEKGNFLLLNELFAKRIFRLHIEAALPKNGTDKGTLFKMRLDLL